MKVIKKYQSNSRLFWWFFATILNPILKTIQKYSNTPITSKNLSGQYYSKLWGWMILIKCFAESIKIPSTLKVIKNYQSKCRSFVMNDVLLQLWIQFWENVQQYLITAITSKNLKWWMLHKVIGLNARKVFHSILSRELEIFGKIADPFWLVML